MEKSKPPDVLPAGVSEKGPLFDVRDVSKRYRMGEVFVDALKTATFQIKHGDFVVVLGPSGSGKSTLLNIMGGMDTPSGGKVFFNGNDITGYNENQLTMFRRHKIGFVFQFYNLMPNLTARENVELAAEISPSPLDIDMVLEKVGLKDRSSNFPAQMSGGEQQRVAIARAVSKNPEVLLCDEPTGALDYSTGVLILKLLHRINRETGKTVIIITHNQPIARMGNMIIKIHSGEINEIIRNENPAAPEEVVW
ncbi:MAG TPA: ABC transporter ATP-binding protein [Candidatus Wallbacteria bacterium]|nr:ABC transporter ATP-binding protein [Candidatus Wallbacteria bacterium]